jgi:hypothetical protein
MLQQMPVTSSSTRTTSDKAAMRASQHMAGRRWLRRLGLCLNSNTNMRMRRMLVLISPNAYLTLHGSHELPAAHASDPCWSADVKLRSASSTTQPRACCLHQHACVTNASPICK